MPSLRVAVAAALRSGTLGGVTKIVVLHARKGGVGKSTTARLLKALLARWPNTPKVELVTTDGFLLPNAELTRLDLMERKGFPESFDTGALLRFLADIKAGKRAVTAPRYSHMVYDVVPGEETTVDVAALQVMSELVDDHGGWSYTTVVAEADELFRVSTRGAEGLSMRWVPEDEVTALPLHPGFAATWPLLADA